MNEPDTRRILVIDDQSAIHEDYRKILGKPASTSSAAAIGQAAAALFGDDPLTAAEWQGFELDSAFQGQEGLELVRRAVAEKRPYAMAFVDIRMPPGWDGIETVRRIWEVDPEMLIVICSAYSDYSWQEMVSELGRNDRYLILRKPFDNIEVRQCAMALTERWSVSRTDALTGLLNRRAFHRYLNLEWSRATRHQYPLACAMVDLDNFKHVNDTLGHQAGDTVLKTVAGVLQAGSRAGDTVCRYGGEEFSVLLPYAGEREAAVWAEKARRAVEAAGIHVGGQPVPLTASIGIAERLASGDGTEPLIDRADQALLAAKAAGRNRVVCFSAIVDSTTDAALRNEDPAGDANRARLMEAARAVAERATRLPKTTSDQLDDQEHSLIAEISELQGLIDDLLARWRGVQQQSTSGDPPSAPVLGPPSGPMVPPG